VAELATLAALFFELFLIILLDAGATTTSAEPSLSTPPGAIVLER